MAIWNVVNCNCKQGVQTTALGKVWICILSGNTVPHNSEIFKICEDPASALLGKTVRISIHTDLLHNFSAVDAMLTTLIRNNPFKSLRGCYWTPQAYSDSGENRPAQCLSINYVRSCFWIKEHVFGLNRSSITHIFVFNNWWHWQCFLVVVHSSIAQIWNAMVYS